LHIPVELTTRSWILTRRFRPWADGGDWQLPSIPPCRCRAGRNRRL